MKISEEILRNLYKYKLYDKFNNNEYENKDEYSRFCENMHNANRILIDFPELCLKYVRNLVTLPKILKGEFNANENCRYFTFWIHDEVRKIDSKRWNLPDRKQYILNSFYQVESAIKDAKQNNNCFYEYSSHIDLDLWMQWKDLYDYIINYDDIKRTIESDGDSCKLYNKYIVDITSIHNKYKAECCNTNYSPMCPDGIKFNEWCDKEERFKKLECDPNKAVSGALTVGGRIPDILDGQESGITYSENGLQRHSDYIAPEETIVNNTDYYTKLSVPLLLLGLSSTFFYLYNFTSFGPLVRSKILGKSKIKDNIYEDAQNLLEYDSDNMVSNLYNDDFHINYNPS
ncbi:PIR Superfamily Protein [Plasmodium ovale wallikeri]|uniref:PIR Superfamily Protein n=1 Tax=Plasmodium ovale wallikeri TaxID=864142 RepID=A0A1A9AP57_PLAOA|nr:PIR Superfamily Protein [Plasmodium ovale wallikeri]